MPGRSQRPRRRSRGKKERDAIAKTAAELGRDGVLVRGDRLSGGVGGFIEHFSPIHTIVEPDGSIRTTGGSQQLSKLTAVVKTAIATSRGRQKREQRRQLEGMGGALQTKFDIKNARPTVSLDRESSLLLRAADTGRTVLPPGATQGTKQASAIFDAWLSQVLRPGTIGREFGLGLSLTSFVSSFLGNIFFFVYKRERSHLRPAPSRRAMARTCVHSQS